MNASNNLFIDLRVIMRNINQSIGPSLKAILLIRGQFGLDTKYIKNREREKEGKFWKCMDTFAIDTVLVATNELLQE